MHAVASITFRADQTVSGVAINMLGVAIALFSVKMIYGKGQTDFIQERFLRFDIPFLNEIPIIGPMFFKDVYGSSILAIGSRFTGLVCHLQNAIWTSFTCSW